MRTLLEEKFAPITSAVGFLELPLSDAASAMEFWRRQLYANVSRVSLCGSLSDVLPSLEPLQSRTRPRELLVAVGDGWTAYFDCGLYGTDASSTIGALSRRVNRRGLAVASLPDTSFSDPGRFGAVQFNLMGPENDGHWLNQIRALDLVRAEGRWVFAQSGPIQPFEEVDAYSARRVRDRFTSEMLERYCQALGVDVFNPDAYGPEAVFGSDAGSGDT